MERDDEDDWETPRWEKVPGDPETTTKKPRKHLK